MALKMYVWADPYSVAYGSSKLVVVAENLRAAKKLAKTGAAYSYGQYSQSNDFARAIVLGKPDRVMSLPYAEWDEWRE